MVTALEPNAPRQQRETRATHLLLMRRNAPLGTLHLMRAGVDQDGWQATSETERRPAPYTSARECVRAVVVALGVAVTLAGCTTGGSVSPRAPSVSASQTAGPSMTPIGEAPDCVAHHDLGKGGDAVLPFSGVFGSGVAWGIDLNEEFRPGLDAGGSRCSVSLPNPADIWCGQAVPWATLDMEDLVSASGARRVRRVGVTADEGRGKEAGSRLSRSLAYVEFELPAQDPKQMGRYLQEAFLNCASGTRQVVGGVSAVVGSVPGPGGESPAVAFLSSTRVAWVVLSGRTWTRNERDRALKAVAAHLS